MLGERGVAYLTLVSVWLTASASATCFAPSALSELLQRLQTRINAHIRNQQKASTEWLLTPIRKGTRATHLMDCSVVFTLSISLIATMPSAV